MPPLTQLKKKYIAHRVDGFSRGRAYQNASGNNNFDSCSKLGSRIELNDPRIIKGIREGLEEKNAILQAEHKRRMVEEARANPDQNAIANAESERLEIENELASSPAYDGDELPPDGYPTRRQCGGTIKGNITRPNGGGGRGRGNGPGRFKIWGGVL